MTLRARGGRAGFTLIEMLAVVLIFALLAGLALPNLGIRAGRTLDEEATRLAATLEFGRQRAVMTGVRHRLVLDLDQGRYWLEWHAPEDPGDEEPAPLGPPDRTLVPQRDASVPLEAPRAGEASFRPLPGDLGSTHWLEEEVYAASVETPSGLAEDGTVEIAFERDGTSASTEVALGSDEGGVLVLELRPLDDTVGIYHEG